MFRQFLPALLLSAAVLSAQPPQFGRGGMGPGSALLAEGNRLDLEGKYADARQQFQKAIDDAATPPAKANAQRSMAMSYAFTGDCGNTVKYERMVIDYWKTQETAQPGNAFYQEGEMADEAARVCIDSGDLDAAAEWYLKGYDSGIREPGISPDRKTLWEFRLEHAKARIAARRGNKAEAGKHVAAARAALDRMTGLKAQQSSFMPYLTGYVAYYTGDYQKALADLQNASQNDPFIQCLLGMTYEKLGEREKATECYRKAAATRAHNPPAAFAKPFASKKLE